MTNEKIIYLGPEEELTSVRERLEHTQAGHIMLVIPPQTQLRSHVGWRVLHSRMRELDKDVLVISSDRQIRAAAKAAGFRVAESKESPPSPRTRPGSHPVRTGEGSKPFQRTRSQPGRSNQDYRSMRSKHQPDQWQRAPQSRSETGSTLSRPGETAAGSGANAASSTFEIQDIKFNSPLHIDSTPSVRPLVPEREEEEPDSLTEDYHVARSIREAAQSAQGAQGADTGAALTPSEIQAPSNSGPDQSSKMPPPVEMDHDLFAYMEDIQPISMREQRASAFIQDIDQGIPDISDIPTDVHASEIEDLGDEGEIMFQHDMSLHSWAAPLSEEPGAQEMPRTYGAPPRNSRMGSLSRPMIEDFGDGDELLPVSPDQTARVSPSSQNRSPMTPTPSTIGRRASQPITPLQSQAQARNVSAKPAPSKAAGKPPVTKGRAATMPPVGRRASAGSNHRGSRIVALVSIVLVVLVLASLVFLYFGSNATVTITVPSQPLTLQNLPYVASTNPRDVQHNTIPSQMLTYTANATGQASTTGTIKQGNAVATGTVNFTNTGSKALDIPTNTVISTSGAVPVQFVTTADVLISSQAVVPVPVQAQNPGESGNAAANSITFIPPSSITSIEQANHGIIISPGTLTVKNPDPASGGGATNVPAVTSNDTAILKNTLHKQVQALIKDWLKKVVPPVDVRGTTVPDVLGSPNPLPQENLVTTPAVGQFAAGGKFTGVLSVTVSVLVIRDTAIRTAARAQLVAEALKKTPISVLASGLPIDVTLTKSSSSPDGTTLSIIVTATGQIVQQFSAQDISNLVAGKGVDQAINDIQSGGAGIIGVRDTRVDIFPSFLGIMPFRPEQIHIIVRPEQVKGMTSG